jgi:Flp pilus assembly protein, ATPase CpaE
LENRGGMAMSQKIRVLVADSSQEARKGAVELLSHEPRIEVVGECSDGEAALKLSADLKPDIVIMDTRLYGLDGFRATEIITSNILNTMVISTSAKGGQHNIKRAMASGAREFIIKPYTGPSLVERIIRLYDRHVENLKLIEGNDFDNITIKPRIITVFSTKGGVGKTMLSTNLAIAIAKKTGEKVVLLDFDFEFGDVPIVLNIYPERTIAGLIEEKGDISPELIEEYLIEHPSGIKVLSAPLSPELAESIKPENVEKVLKSLSKNYKYIVIDTSPTFQDVNLTTFDMSDRILFITTLDLSTIKNVKSGLLILKSLKFDDSKVDIILNRFNRRIGISLSDLERTIGKSILHTIPEDNNAVVDSVNSGNPIVMDENGSGIARSIREIAGIVIGETETTKDSLLSVLKRIFHI